ncbi:MAG: J domain-containing protein, partial [Bdellovibrionales bacterium]|nr:J domain-containing protein [Bdellovibrionales bacterium]
TLDGLAQVLWNPEAAEVFWPFDVPQVRNMLTRMQAEVLTEQQSAVLQEKVAEVFAARTYERALRGDVEGASRAHELLLERRPNPNEKNNRLALHLAERVRTPATRGLIDRWLGEAAANGGVGLGDRAKLLLGGYYGLGLPLMLVAVLLLIALVPFFILARSAPRQAKPYSESELAAARRKKWMRQPTPWEEDGIHRSIPPGEQPSRGMETSGPRYMQPSSGLDEYSRLLLLFGFEEEVSDEELKRAYREMAKDLHPDRLADIDAEEREQAARRFDELKHAHARILEIRKSRFGGS